MYIKVVTTRIKPKHRRAKIVYQYVKVLSSQYSPAKGYHTERVVATLGALHDVKPHVETLCRGLQQLARI